MPETLAAAGVPVDYEVLAEGTIHGFMNMGPRCCATRMAARGRALQLARRAFARGGKGQRAPFAAQASAKISSSSRQPAPR